MTEVPVDHHFKRKSGMQHQGLKSKTQELFEFLLCSE